MIDTHDTLTATLPAIEPAPAAAAAPQRLTAPQRRASQSYIGPKQRNGCHNCISCAARVWSAGTTTERLVPWCDIGAFEVNKGGICPDWTDEVQGVAEMLGKLDLSAG